MTENQGIQELYHERCYRQHWTYVTKEVPISVIIGAKALANKNGRPIFAAPNGTLIDHTQGDHNEFAAFREYDMLRSRPNASTANTTPDPNVTQQMFMEMAPPAYKSEPCACCGKEKEDKEVRKQCGYPDCPHRGKASCMNCIVGQMMTMKRPLCVCCVNDCDTAATEQRDSTGGQCVFPHLDAAELRRRVSLSSSSTTSPQAPAHSFNEMMGQYHTEQRQSRRSASRD